MDDQTPDPGDPNSVHVNDDLEMLASTEHLVPFEPHDCLMVVAWNGRQSNGASARFNLTTPPSFVAETMKPVPNMDSVTLVAYVEEPLEVVRDAIAYHLGHTAGKCQQSGIGVLAVYIIASDLVIRLDNETTWPRVAFEAARDRIEAHAGVPRPRNGIFDGSEKLPMEPARTRAELLVILSGRIAAVAADTQPLPYALGTKEHWVNTLELAATVDAEDLTIDQLADLMLMLDKPSGRDFAVVQWATSAEHALEFWDVRWSDEVPDHILPEQLIPQGVGIRPDLRRMQRVIATMRRIEQFSDVSAFSYNPLLLAGWCEWAVSNSERAGVYLRRAMEVAEHNHIKDQTAQKLYAYITRGHLPKWAYDEGLMS